MRVKRVAIVLMASLMLLCYGGIGSHSMPTAQAADPLEMFGDGSDGPIVFSVNTVFTPPVDAVVDSASSGGTTITVSSASGVFQPGQKILVHQTRGAAAGAWEINEVQSYALGNITTVLPLANAYATSGADAAQVLVVPEYTDFTVDAGATLTAKPWNSVTGTGGILAFMANATVAINGTISAAGSDSNVATNSPAPGATGGGFIGGNSHAGSFGQAQSGEGTDGPPAYQTAANGSGGGGALVQSPGAPGSTGFGGGGGNGTGGGSSQDGQGTRTGGEGGNAAGSADLSSMVFGGGGGGGATSSGIDLEGSGASGGGILVLIGKDVVTGAAGLINADGGAGQYHGGGGAGGSVLMRVQTAALGTSLVTAVGGGYGDLGSGGTLGGAGRIRAEYCTSISGGVAEPPASVVQVSCDLEPNPDPDGDGICDPGVVDQSCTGSDNCPTDYNPSQENSDSGPPPPAGRVGAIGNGVGVSEVDGTVPNGDDLGDVCDPDNDNDGIDDASDADPGIPRDDTYDDNGDGTMLNAADDGPSWDNDGNGIRDGVEATCGSLSEGMDSDLDGLDDKWETCKWGTDTGVVDTDGDSLGDCVEAADVNGDAVVDFVGDVIYYGKAALVDPSVFGKDGDFDINGDGTVDFVGDVIQEAKFALVAGLCQ